MILSIPSLDPTFAQAVLVLGKLVSLSMTTIAMQVKQTTRSPQFYPRLHLVALSSAAGLKMLPLALNTFDLIHLLPPVARFL